MLLCSGWKSVCLSFISGFVTTILPSIQTRPTSYYLAPYSGLRLFHPSPLLALPALQFSFPAISKSSASPWTTHYPSTTTSPTCPDHVIIISCSPPHSLVNQRRRLQDDCVLNGRFSSGLCKLCVPRRFSQGYTQTRAYPEHTGQSSIVTRQHGRTSISATLQKLHWLPIKWGINFKVATLIYKVFESGERSYLSSKIAIAVPSRSLRSSADTRRLVVFHTNKTSALELSDTQLRPSGPVFHSTCARLLQC